MTSQAEKLIRRNNLIKGEEELEILVAWDYRVRHLDTYHFRINDRLDVWPSSKKWFDQRTRRSGTYDNLESFVEGFLPPAL